MRVILVATLAVILTGCAVTTTDTPPVPVTAGSTVAPTAAAPTEAPSAAAASEVPSTAVGSATASSGNGALHMVVIGDSIPFGGHFCPGCMAFVDEYASTLQTRLGRPVEVSNRSRDDSAGMNQIESQVNDDTSLRQELAAADVVVVSVGYNNALPDSSTGVGCGGDIGSTNETYITWALATKPDCLQAGIDTYAAQYDRIFSAITDLRKGKPTLFSAINVHDGNLGDPGFVGANISAEARAAMTRWIIAAYDRWNPMLCAKAKQHGFACVDVYHAFNGPNGDRTSDAFTIDHAHPSQAGNDLIASLLAKLDTKVLTQ